MRTVLFLMLAFFPLGMMAQITTKVSFDVKKKILLLTLINEGNENYRLVEMLTAWSGKLTSTVEFCYKNREGEVISKRKWGVHECLKYTRLKEVLLAFERNEYDCFAPVA